MPHTALPGFHIPQGTSIVQAQAAQSERVSLDSPGVQVMTDLAQVRAVTVQPNSPLAQAELKMIHQGLRLLFVVEQLPGAVGIVTAADLQGEKPMRLVHQRMVKFEELCVADVMTSLADMDAVDYTALRRANVSQVIAALRHFGRAHLLVAEPASQSHPLRIRGVISLSQIERQLGTELPLTGMATSFSEMSQALA